MLPAGSVSSPAPCREARGNAQVRVVDARERNDLAHVGDELALEVPFEDLGAAHGLVERHAADVPAADDEVVGVDHREHVADGDVHVLARLGVKAEAHCGSNSTTAQRDLRLTVWTSPTGSSADERADVVWRLDTVARVPADVVAVREHGAGEGRAVVAAEADEHQTVRPREPFRRLRHLKQGRDSPGPGHLAGRLELDRLLDGCDLVAALGRAGDRGVLVSVDRMDVRVLSRIPQRSLETRPGRRLTVYWVLSLWTWTASTGLRAAVGSMIGTAAVAAGAGA